MSEQAKPTEQPPFVGASGSAMELLKEIRERDRQAIAELQSNFPWYKPEPELLDLHSRMDEVIRRESPNAVRSTTPGGQP